MRSAYGNLIICCHARQVKVLPVPGTQLPLLGGAAHRLVDDAQNGAAGGVLTAEAAAAELALDSAALFIDQNVQQLGPIAATKWGGWGWGGHGW